jgi:CHAT domain-containing protein
VDLAWRATCRFEKLGMNYERAKALTFSGIGEHLRQNTRQALLFFSKARRLFSATPNSVWSAIVDYYRCILLRDIGQTRAALRLAVRTERVFESEALPHRRALVQLVIAGLFLDRDRLRQALEYVGLARTGLSSADHPMLFFYAEYLRGRILRMQGDMRSAFSAFSHAAELLETVRCRLGADDLKVAFVRNKLDVYAQLMLLSHELASIDDRGAAIFNFIEKSKSRSLTDRIAFLETNPPEQSREPGDYTRTREKLNALYREIDLRESDRRDVRILRHQAQSLERQLTGLLREQSLDDQIPAGTADWTPVSLETVATTLPAGAQIVEFFITDQQLWVGVIGKTGATFKNLGVVDAVESAIKLLAFQLSTFQHHKNTARDRLGQTATLSHLQELYRLLIRPIESLIQADHLIVLPHGLLHQLPFHALHDGSSYLIERSTVSYAPSATVFCLCERKARRSGNRSLLVGVPDEKSPAIAAEIQSIEGLLPGPLVFLGEQATAGTVFAHAGSCRYIHIAAHGKFRSDNPMFSSIGLVDSQVSVHDFYRLRLDAELVTLSGCSTGVGITAAGDELVGLARGLMHAGARAVLLALWEVHDSSTATFMQYFYKTLVSGKSCAEASRDAIQQLKRDWSEPYYWAPFAVSGYALQPQDMNFSRPYISG